VGVQSDPHRVFVTVTDRGPGIAPEDHERIFEPFERAGDDPLVCGFGLGLWTARRLVDAHHGTLHVASARGEGARFTVELPRDSRSTAGAC
jgi:signal transduction histidine kinase